jgi:RNA methyltransferase, TrmH family
MIKTIASKANPEYRRLLSLLTSKGIKKEGEFIVSGIKVVDEILSRKNHGGARYLILTAEQLEDQHFAHTFATAGNLKKLQVPNELFEELDIFGTHAPLLLCEVPEIPEWLNENQLQEREILCALSDPSNLGACIRTAAAFGFSKMVLLKECASPLHPRAIRSASGSFLSMKFVKGPSIHELISSNLIALDMNGENISEFKWPEHFRLLIGEEGQGVPKFVKAIRLTIPIEGVESLNATVAASIAMFSASQ